MPAGGGEDRVGVGGVDAVEADEGVEVHDAAALELGDLAVGDPQLDAVRAFERPERAGRAAIMVRRHSSPAKAFQTTWWAWS